MTRVLFVRLHITAADKITECLTLYYSNGWHVVTMSESRDEYTFVLEQSDEP